jgi:hypothetical protein
VAKLSERELSLQQEVEENGLDWVEDKRLYLLSTGRVGDPLYSSTWEAVCTLKHLIRGIDMRQSIMMDTCYISDGGEMIDIKWGNK